jgi:integrase
VISGAAGAHHRGGLAPRLPLGHAGARPGGADRIIPGDHTEEAGIRAAARLGDGRVFVAVIVPNDRCAVGLLDGSRGAGVAFPLRYTTTGAGISSNCCRMAAPRAAEAGIPILLSSADRSRRTLGLPVMAVEALRSLADSQADKRLVAGEGWQDTGLAFTTHRGAALDAGNVRKMFKRVCTQAGIGNGWTPRDLRTTFVSLMSHRGVSIEEIARLVGHASTRTTEVVYRRELRPVRCDRGRSP